MFFNIRAPFITIFIFYLSLCACFNINKIDGWDEMRKRKEAALKALVSSANRVSYNVVFVNEIYKCKYMHDIMLQICVCVCVRYLRLYGRIE